MDIVYAANDGYARHLGVSLYSLLDHNQTAEEIQVWILSMGLTEESKERLTRIIQEFGDGRGLEFIEMGDLKERFSYQVDTGGFDLSIMARLFIGEALPENVSRILYLDCDTVVLRSLERLWNTPLHGCVLGAVMEPTIYPEIREQIGLGQHDPYYNSGVLLIDMDAWRRDGTEKQLLDFYQQMGGHLFAGDQDTINGALKGRIRPLPPVWNFFPNYRYFHYSSLVKMEPAYQMVSKRMFRRVKRHPGIIHYMGDERPWKAGNLNHYRRAYDQYLALTPWAGTPKEEGSRLYLSLYHLMDYATFLCPPVRSMISRGLGMKVVNARKKG